MASLCVEYNSFFEATKLSLLTVTIIKKNTEMIDEDDSNNRQDSSIK